ncbi:MAG: hypothetical protein QXU20_04805 [Candidatus Woesearchaeota archaeon]
MGKTVYYQKNEQPTDCVSVLGNTAPSFYYEKYNGWNGSGYQDYAFAYNDAGFREGSEILLSTGPNEKGQYVIKKGMHCMLPSDDARKKYVFNTFVVGNLDLIKAGVNRRQVWMLE